MNFNQEDLSNSKKPLYITIYDRLYKLIMEGTFPPESRLPSEPELAKRMGVSRMTLRQALALLQDDGLVKNVHGKGNFITKSHHNHHSVGLEKVGNPVYKCHTERIDTVDMEFRIDLSSDYAEEILKKNMAAVVAFERWYKSGEVVVGYGLTMMAIDTVAELNLDLQNKDEVLDMLEKKVYELANSSTIEIKRSHVGNKDLQELFKGEECDLILEGVYISDQYPVVYNKFYIPREFSKIKINAVK